MIEELMDWDSLDQYGWAMLFMYSWRIPCTFLHACGLLGGTETHIYIS